jgi:hypothetical protein
MPSPAPLPIPWTPRSTPDRVTPAKPRIIPAPSGRPTAPHPLRTLPPRTLPTPEPAAPEQTRSAPLAAASAGHATGWSANAPNALTALSAAVAVRHGIALKQQATLQALLDVDDAAFAALVDDGAVLVVPLAVGRRYVLADAVPAAALAEVGTA